MDKTNKKTLEEKYYSSRVFKNLYIARTFDVNHWYELFSNLFI